MTHHTISGSICAQMKFIQWAGALVVGNLLFLLNVRRYHCMYKGVCIWMESISNNSFIYPIKQGAEDICLSVSTLLVQFFFGFCDSSVTTQQTFLKLFN